MRHISNSSRAAELRPVADGPFPSRLLSLELIVPRTRLSTTS